jgi:hypothetical protein
MSTEGASARVASEPTSGFEQRRIADRYDLEGLLGKGGMATAYRALDVVGGKQIALKLLSTDAAGPKAARDIELFEREYHTLVELAHPRVVRAFEYGVDGETPYYTMELLDGGDLQTLAPMRWQDAVVAAYEIGSALSMLHSRRLVHRDLTPRNIRRTADGKAKLIDFGLLSPMGPPTILAGTPPYVPPELVNSVTLDGRSDLFSLGATLYFVLTGRHAFPARRFDQLRDIWRSSPPAPSRIVNTIPPALDAIVLSMLRIDPGSRPKSAAEVMERLLPMLPVAPDDDLRVAAAHLTTPRLVGRGPIVQRFRKRALGAARGKGGGFLVAGDPGLGRSRMLDAFVLEAKLAGATTARAGAANAAVPFGVATILVTQLHAALPDRAESLADVTRTDLEHGERQAAMRSWLLELSKRRALAIAVDDFDEIDEPSAALLASLTWEAPKHQFVYALSVGTGAASATTVLDVVKKHAERIDLAPLGPEETSELLASIFGDTANLQLLSQRLHALSGGRPRECMTFAQFLVDRGVITYNGGAFTLPSEIPDELLPANIETALAEQVARLSPLARRLAAMLSLELTERLSRAQLVRLQDATPGAVDAALRELAAIRLISGDDAGYALRERSLTPLIAAKFDDAEHSALHQSLAELGARSIGFVIPEAYHRLLGARPEEGLELLLSHALDSESRTQLANISTDQLGAERAGITFSLALAEATRLGRPRKHRQAFWVMLAGVGAQGENASYYYDVPAEWLEHLKRESGWYDWQTLDASLDPASRAMMAVGAAYQRFAAAPEDERVLSPMDAIKQLVGYVVFSISVAARVFDLELQASLPELLEPFVPLDPMVAAMLANARGTLLNGQGKREAAHQVFVGVASALDEMAHTLAYANKIRAAISHTLAELDASAGVTSVWTRHLDDDTVDSNQRVAARYLQKVSALHQGNWEAAERYRQQAELTELQSRARSMFSTLGHELEAHAMARDLTGLRQVRSAIHGMAEKHPGWVPVRHMADAQYQRLCGDLEGAAATARLARTAPLGKVRCPWALQAAAVEAELLTELGRPAEALEFVSETLAECEREGMRHLARGLSCAVALAEGKLGRIAQAMARLDGVIEEQKALGVTGLALGRSYEYGARLAIWSTDTEAFERLATLAAEQYRPGENSMLGALYERLMEEARQAGLGVTAAVSALGPEARGTDSSASESVTSAMADCSDRRARAERALALLCDGDPPRRGHLFYIGDTGLELVASNEMVASPSSLTAFAQDRIDVETGPSETMTAAMDTPGDPSVPLTWHASDGATFTTVLLASQVRSSVVIAGVLVLAEQGMRPRDFDEIASAVARVALETGDARGLRTA